VGWHGSVQFTSDGCETAEDSVIALKLVVEKFLEALNKESDDKA